MVLTERHDDTPGVVRVPGRLAQSGASGAESAAASSPPTLLIANPSGDIYGSDLQMLQSAAAMVDRGWRVVVVMPSSGPLVGRLRQLGAEVMYVSFPVLRRSDANPAGIAALAGQAAAALPRLCRLLRELKPTVVYVNTVTIPWWLYATRLTGFRSVCHVHEAENGDSKMIRTALNLPLLLADALISISRATTEATTLDLPRLRQRTHLIYNGVPGPGEPLPSAPATPPVRLVVVGRLSPRKAPHVALEALAQLRRRRHDVVLQVCGTPFAGYEWYERKLRARAAQDDLAGAVQFSGYVSPIWPAVGQAHVVLAPSIREPFGNAVVEAQLAGRPVVAAAAMGHLESVSDGCTGVLVKPGDAAAMAAGVERLLDDPAASARIVREAMQRAHDQCGLPRYRERVAGLLGDLQEAGERHAGVRLRRPAGQRRPHDI